jgi:SAM-dependent methyltransferase
MDPEVRDFYVDGICEDERLRLRPHGVLERVRTQELLARFLPPAPAAVLDVGGGTGVHAEWLAQRGYFVHLIDPVEEHVAVAAGLRGVSSAAGDARWLLTNILGAQRRELAGGHLLDDQDLEAIYRWLANPSP